MSIPDSHSAGEARPYGVSPPSSPPPTERELFFANRQRLATGPNGEWHEVMGHGREAWRRKWARGAPPSKNLKKAMRVLVYPRDHYACRDCDWAPGPPPAGWDGTHTLGAPEPEPYGVLAQWRYLNLGHIIPATEGGPFEESNLRTQCSRCNIGEGNRIRAAHDRGLTLDGKRPWPQMLESAE